MEKAIRPDDYCYIPCTLVLKPWKGKPGQVTYMINAIDNVTKEVDKLLAMAKESGELKRRTVLAIRLEYSKYYKL